MVSTLSELHSAVDSVHRKCLKYIFFKSIGYYPPSGFDHTALLEQFKVVSLADRRNCAASMLLKIFNNKIDRNCLKSI